MCSSVWKTDSTNYLRYDYILLSVSIQICETEVFLKVNWILSDQLLALIPYMKRIIFKSYNSLIILPEVTILYFQNYSWEMEAVLTIIKVLS